MRARALLALMVLLSCLAAQLGTGGAPRGEPLSTRSLYLSASTAPPHLLAEEPPEEGSVELYTGGSAEFTVSNFSGLLVPGEVFELSLLLVSLNVSNMSLSISLSLHPGGGGEGIIVYFESYTSKQALVPERATLRVSSSSGDCSDLALVEMTLRLKRTDELDGWLRVVCGSGSNSSVLRTPYSRPLMADAGPDISTKLNRTVLLNASGSRSAAPGETEYLWELAAPDGSTWAASRALAEVALNQTGTYNVTLRLRWHGFEDLDTTLINVVPNLPPVAEAVVVGSGKANTSYLFLAEALDSDGQLVLCSWDFGDGASAEGFEVWHNYTSPGDHRVVLLVRDDDGAEARDELLVHINQPPRISRVDVNWTGREATFRAVATDPDNERLNYEWSFGDGELGAGVETRHRYAGPGTFRVSCTVSDPLEEGEAFWLNVVVGNSPPQAVTKIQAPREGYVEEAIHFKADVVDLDGDELSYQWSFGDGASSAERSPYHIYKTPSEYMVTLMVSDGHSNLTLRTTVDIKEKEMQLDPGMLSSMICFAIFIIGMVAALLRVMRQRAGQQPGQPPAPYSPPPAGPPYPATHAPRLPPPKPRPPITACTRCGSTNLIGFPDGHVKCADCKKIMFNG
ncbi:MAG: PKD domain-containing protein [Thermoplasmatota archaeon]